MGSRQGVLAGALALLLIPAVANAACPVQAPRTRPTELGGVAGQCAKARETGLKCSRDLPSRATSTQGPRIKVTGAGTVTACVTAPRPQMVGREARCVVREQRQRLGEIDVACSHRADKHNACPEMQTIEIYRAEDVAGRATYCWVVQNANTYRSREYRFGVDFRGQTRLDGLLRAKRHPAD